MTDVEHKSPVSGKHPSPRLVQDWRSDTSRQQIWFPIRPLYLQPNRILMYHSTVREQICFKGPKIWSPSEISICHPSGSRWIYSANSFL